MAVSAYQTAREELERWLAVSNPRELRQYFEDYPPVTLPDLFQKMTVTEIEYLCVQCKIAEKDRYQTWVLLAKNVPQALQRLKSDGLDIVGAVEASVLPRRKGLFLMLYAADTYQFLQNRASGRTMANENLRGVQARHEKIRRHAEAILKDTKGRVEWHTLQRELMQYLLHCKQRVDAYTGQVRRVTAGGDMPHHNTARRYKSVPAPSRRRRQNRPYMPPEVYRVAWSVIHLFEEKGEKEAQKATRALFSAAGIILTKNNLATRMTERRKREGGTM